MAARLLSRSKAVTFAVTRTAIHPAPSPIDPIVTSQCLRSLHSLRSLIPSSDSRSAASGSASKVGLAISPAISAALQSGKLQGYEKTFSHRWFCGRPQSTTLVNQQHNPTSQIYHSVEEKASRVRGIEEGASKEVICFSPLEAVATKTRGSGLVLESQKIKINELSQKLTYGLIPILLLVSKSSLTTSLLIFSVYWQIYGFFKEIFLDYVHHEVTRKWVLVYLKVLLVILAKETVFFFDLV